MEKISLNSSTMTIEEAFKYFLFAKTAQGLTKKTIQGYRDHFHCISRYLDTSMELAQLKKKDTQQMITSMRSNGLATNTIASYVKAKKSSRETKQFIKKFEIRTSQHICKLFTIYAVKSEIIFTFRSVLFLLRK